MLEARTLARDQVNVLELGLQADMRHGHSIQDADCREKPLFPAVNTLLTELLKAAGLRFNSSSVDGFYTSFADVAVYGKTFGSAAAFFPGPGTAATFRQRRPDGKVHSRPNDLVPFLFDAAAPFDIELAGGTVPMIIAFQHRAIRPMSAKMAGRLKAMGCTLGDPRGWAMLKRVYVLSLCR